MTEFLDENESILSESFSISEPTIKDENISPRGNLQIEENVKDYPIRCSDCWLIPRISFNFKKKNFCTKCEKDHKNIFMSYEDLCENADKKFSSLLCHKCKQDKDVNYRCNDDNLFFCSKCRNELKSKNFSDLTEIDVKCPNHHLEFKYLDTDKYKHLCEECYKEQKENYKTNLIEIEKYVNYKDTIDKYYQKSIENIKIWNNISKLIKNWLKNINNKFNDFINSIGDYCLLQQKIVNFLKIDNSYEKYKNNYFVFSNYKAINDEKIDLFIRRINGYVNYKYNKYSDLGNMTEFFIGILKEFNQTDININSNYNMIIQEKGKEDDKQNEIKLIKEMKRKILELPNDIKCFIPFQKENYVILGYNTGEIQIAEIEGDIIKDKLKFKVFDLELSHICEIDKNLIIASDIKNNIKIIEIEEDLNDYTVIKNIDMDESTKIHKIISLPIISYFKNKQFFGISTDESVLIYKSNKMPSYLDPPYLQYHNKVEEYSIVQPFPNQIEQEKSEKLKFSVEKRISIKEQFDDILEINDTYLAVACPKSKSLRLFNTQKEFQEAQILHNVIPNQGCFMKVSKSKKELIIGYNGGFNIIDFENLQRVRNITIKQNIQFFDFIGLNNLIILSISSKFNDEVGDANIRQYRFRDGFKEINKLSEVVALSQNKITNFFVIKEKIYYINNTNKIVYYD